MYQKVMHEPHLEGFGIMTFAFVRVGEGLSGNQIQVLGLGVRSGCWSEIVWSERDVRGEG